MPLVADALARGLRACIRFTSRTHVDVAQCREGGLWREPWPRPRMHLGVCLSHARRRRAEGLREAESPSTNEHGMTCVL